MPEPVAFSALVHRLREGAPGAVEEFLASYGDEIRLLAHLKCLPYRYARPDVDSEEVHQSVVATFCVCVQLGKFENLDTPIDLKRLLHRLVRNKVIDRVRKYGGSVKPAGSEVLETCQAAARPDSARLQMEIEEMRRKARELLSADEWDLVRRRQEGESWDEIARALHESAEALRKRHDRAVKRALDLLGLAEASHG